MKVKYFLFSAACAFSLFSCKKDCEKPPVETPAECTTWNKLLGGTQTEAAYSSVKTLDGGYILVGSTQSNDGDIAGYHGGTDLLVFKVDKNGNKVWQKAFGGTNLDIGTSIIAATDGGYIISGNTLSTNGDVTGSHGLNDVWILKIDEQGNILWQRAWGGMRNDQAFAAASVSDGYIIAIASASTDGDLPATNESANTWLVKLRTDGTVSWQKPVGVDFFEDVPSKIMAVADGFIIAGYVYNATGKDARVVKTDAEGNIVWQKTFGGMDHDVFSDITGGTNGGYILTGYTTSSDGDITGNTRGDYDLLVVKIDGNGNKEWLKIFEGSGVDGLNGTSVVKTADGHYMVATYTVGNNGDAGTNHGATDVWVLKLNASGSKVGQKLLGGTENDYMGNLIQASDCGYLLVGSSFSNNGDITGNHSAGFSDVWLSKIKEF